MRNKSIHLFTVVFFVSSMLSINGALRAQSKGGTAPNKPPMAEKKSKILNIHGEQLVDDYFWLRERTDPAVLAHLQAEDAYTEQVMKPTAALQEKVYKEMLSHIKQTDTNVPYRWGNYFYYTRTEEGKQYPIYCRKRGSLDAPEEIVIDQNELAKGQKFMSIGLFVPSDDGNLLAYSTDNTGYRQYTLQIKDLRNGQLFPERIERVNNLAWATDNKTFFYVTEDRPVLKITMTGNFRGERVEWKPPSELLQQEELNAYEVILDTPEGKRIETLYVYGDQVAVKAKVLRFRPILNVLGFTNLCQIQYVYNGYSTAERFNHYPHRAQEISVHTPVIANFQKRFWNFWEEFYYLRRRSSLVKSATLESTYFPLVEETGRPFQGSYFLTVTTGGLSSIRAD